MGTIDEVFEWVDSSLNLWRQLSEEECISNEILEKKPVEENSEGNLEYVSEGVKYIRILERTFASVSEFNSRYILNRLFRLYNVFYRNDPKELPLPLFPAYSFDGLKSVIYWDMIMFYSAVCVSCEELGLDIKTFCTYDIPSEYLPIRTYSKPIELKYEKVSRTYTMAAMWAAVDKFFPNELSREKKAAFIEIITGGNAANAYDQPRKTFAYTSRDKRVSDKRGGKAEVDKILDLIGLKSE